MEKPYEMSDGTFLKKNEIDFWRIHTNISNPFVFEQNSIWDLLQTFTTISGSILLRQKGNQFSKMRTENSGPFLFSFFLFKLVWRRLSKYQTAYFRPKKMKSIFGEDLATFQIPSCSNKNQHGICFKRLLKLHMASFQSKCNVHFLSKQKGI